MAFVFRQAGRPTQGEIRDIQVLQHYCCKFGIIGWSASFAGIQVLKGPR
jgi:hypothetical protein